MMKSTQQSNSVYQKAQKPTNRAIQAQMQNIELPEQLTGDINEYIEVLMEHQMECQSKGKYIEAEMAKNRIKELREQDKDVKEIELVQKQESEKEEIEKAHLNEFNEFNEFWDQKMEEFDREAKKIEEQMIAKQQEELDNFEKQLEDSIPLKPKHSAKILNLKAVELQLAKKQEYIEAHQVQQECLQLEKFEQEQWQKQRKDRIQNQLKQLKIKQQNELKALAGRIASGQDEQRKVRSQELERLLQKYQNVQKELEIQQQNEAMKLKRNMNNSLFMKTRFNASSSRMEESQQQQNSKSQKKKKETNPTDENILQQSNQEDEHNEQQEEEHQNENENENENDNDNENDSQNQ